MAKTERIVRHPWSVPVMQAEVPQSGRHFHLVVDASTRASIAQLAGVPDLPRLEASFDVTPHGSNGLHVVGRVSATVGQICSVTLEPMTSELNEDVDLVFLPPAAAEPRQKSRVEIEVLLDDEPEALIDGRIDLGILATEFLVLGINPYPRKPDTVFRAASAEANSARPFAALANLEKTPQPSSTGTERKKS
jgi:uncharacterized metal-binding protein YceD (DUF177 family)